MRVSKIMSNFLPCWVSLWKKWVFDIEIQFKGEIAFILKVQLRRIETRYKDARSYSFGYFFTPWTSGWGSPKNTHPMYNTPVYIHRHFFPCTFIWYNGQLKSDFLSSSFPLFLSSFPFLLTRLPTLFSSFPTLLFSVPFCSPVFLFCSPVFLFCSSVFLFCWRVLLFCSRARVFLFCSPVFLFCSPVFLFCSPVFLFCSPVFLLCCQDLLLRYWMIKSN